MSAAGDFFSFKLLIITHNYIQNVNKESLFTSSLFMVQIRSSQILRFEIEGGINTTFLGPLIKCLENDVKKIRLRRAKIHDFYPI